jgi:hypothetical protein
MSQPVTTKANDPRIMALPLRGRWNGASRPARLWRLLMNRWQLSAVLAGILLLGCDSGESADDNA